MNKILHNIRIGIYYIIFKIWNKQNLSQVYAGVLFLFIIIKDLLKVSANANK